MRAIPRIPFIALAVALGLQGCSAAPPGSGAGDTGDEARTVIALAELEDHRDVSVLQAVRRLRPNWLRYRGQSVLEGPEREGLRVYLDGAFYGDAEALGALQVRTVREVRFLDARQATLRFGTGHTVGAILVLTRR